MKCQRFLCITRCILHVSINSCMWNTFLNNSHIFFISNASFLFMHTFFDSTNKNTVPIKVRIIWPSKEKFLTWNCRIKNITNCIKGKLPWCCQYTWIFVNIFENFMEISNNFHADTVDIYNLLFIEQLFRYYISVLK